MRKFTFIKSTLLLFAIGLVMLTNLNVNASNSTKNTLEIESVNPVFEGLETAVTAPVAKAATNITLTSFQANWDYVAGVDGYVLYVYTKGKNSNRYYLSSYNPKPIIGSKNTTAKVEGLKVNTTYYYVLKSVVAPTGSTESNEISVKTLATAPDAPVATAATDITATSFTANWDAADGASSYMLTIGIRRDAANGGGMVAISGYNKKTLDGLGTSYVIPEGVLESGIEYTYIVYAVNEFGTSGPSNWIDVTTEIPMTYVPDDNFEQALIDLGYDTAPLDDYVPTENINTITILDINGESIADLTGIEDFTALTNLKCQDNQLTTLNVSANTELTSLWCTQNQLTSLNLSANTVLTTLVCWTNVLETLDLRANAMLTNLSCGINKLETLDLTANTELTTLYCGYNQLTSLDVSANIALSMLKCYNNQLISLDLNTNLTELNCSTNQLETLDVSANTSLVKLFCNDNQFSSLDVSTNTALEVLYCNDNKLTSLNLKNGNNSNMLEYTSSGNTYSSMKATNNPNLTCIEVDDQAAVDDTYGWLKDATASYSEDCDAAMTYVPDDNFEQALIDLGYDTAPLDDYVPTENINTLTNLNIYDKGIADLTGIEDFTALTKLICNYNQLTSLDLHANTALLELYCNDNDLTALDVSANTGLVDLYCSFNDLTSLDVSANTSLEKLNCNNSRLTSLNVSTNTVLSELKCYNSKITALDISANTALTVLYCQNNDLISLDVSANTALVKLLCYDNQLSSLDVSANTSLEKLNCNDNQLTSLNLKNGNNSNMLEYTSSGNTYSSMKATNNPNLTCIEVDDQAAVDDTYGWLKDATASYSEDCDAAMTYVPDDNFEQALITKGFDDVLDDYVLTANINTLVSLNVSNRTIADLTGIEDFVALETLWCSENILTSLNVATNINLTLFACNDNQLTRLDVSTNTALEELYCHANRLTSLDLSTNTALEGLVCEENQLTSLDLSTNTALLDLTCGDNPLEGLYLSANTVLEGLDCKESQLTSLDLSANPLLTYLDCTSNLLTSLNVKNGNNTNFTDFRATDNPNLTCIEVDDAAWSTTNWTDIDATASFSQDCSAPATYVPDDNFEQALIDLGYDTAPLDDYVPTANINTLTSLDVSNKGIANLTGLEDFTNLTSLLCSSNALTSLDVSPNTALTILSCSVNKLVSLDVSANIKLKSLQCHSNQLTLLDVSANTDLTWLLCSVNELTSLDVSKNTSLTNLYCKRNQLISLDVSTNSTLQILDCNGNQLTSLNIKNGNNSNMLEYTISGNTYTGMDATSNPDLTCIEVDDQAAVDDTYGWLKDATASYSVNCGVPATPVVLNATDITATSFTANWEAADGATSYKLSILSYPEKNYIDGYNEKPIDGLGTSFVIPENTLEPGKQYSFRVCAVNDAGESNWSNNRSVTTLANYTLSLSATPVAGGTVSGEGAFDAGTSVTAQATASAGYKFVKWTDAGSSVSTSSSYTFALNANTALVAVFEEIPATQYTLSLSATPVAGGTVSGEGAFDDGTSVTAQATASDGYKFIKWTNAGSSVSTLSSYTFALNANTALVAVFEEIPTTQYTLSLSATPAAGGTVSGEGAFDDGTSVTAQATASDGYKFIKWTNAGSSVSTLSSYTFALNANTALVAVFEEIPATQYTLNLSATPAAGGTVSGEGVFDDGTSVIVTATANDGYTFINWTEDGTEVSTEPTYTFVLNENTTLVANFTLKTSVDNKVAMDIKVWPNPTSNFIQISQIPNGSSIKVTSLIGKVVFQKEDSQNMETVNMEMLKKGIYILIIENKQGCYTHKMIKN